MAWQAIVVLLVIIKGSGNVYGSDDRVRELEGTPTAGRLGVIALKT